VLKEASWLDLESELATGEIESIGWPQRILKAIHGTESIAYHSLNCRPRAAIDSRL